MKKLLFFFTSLISIALSAQVQDTVHPKLLNPIEQYQIGTGFAKNPLKPPVTTSPRATLFSFMANMHRSHQLILEAHEMNQKASLFNTPDSLTIKERQAEVLFERAISCLDLSEVPEAIKLDISYEKVLLLKELLDRIEIPHFEEVPNESMPCIIDSKKNSTSCKWKLPDTDITIERIMDGPNSGEFLFSTNTVEYLEDYYGTIKRLPYTKSEFSTPDFFTFYIGSPGRLLPPKWTKFLPKSLTTSLHFSNTPWQWITFLILISFMIILTRISYLFLFAKTLADQATKYFWRRSLFFISLIIILAFGIYAESELINLTGLSFLFFRSVLTFLLCLMLSIAVFYLISAASEYILSSNRIHLSGIQRAYIRAITTIFSLFFSIAALVIGLTTIGVSLTPMLTGVGIGGLAIAIAARSSLESVISSFTIFANRPYKIGDRVNILGHQGSIKEIGLFSTKVQRSDGIISIIPNQKIITSEVENIDQRPFIRRKFNVIISYGSQPFIIEKAKQLVENVLSLEYKQEEVGEVHPNTIINQPDRLPRVYFDEIINDNQSIQIYYWFHSTSNWEFQKHASWINQQIMEQFAENGIVLAIPNQRVFVSNE